MAYLEENDSFEHRFSGTWNHSLWIKIKMVIDLLLTFSQIFDLEFWIKVENDRRSVTDHGCPIVHLVRIGTSTLGYYLSSHKPCVEIMNWKIAFFYLFFCLNFESQINHGKSLAEKSIVGTLELWNKNRSGDVFQITQYCIANTQDFNAWLIRLLDLWVPNIA